MKGAILLISGGLDSVVLAHYLKKTKKVRDLKLVFIDYGQRSFKEELFCVEKASKELGAELKVIDLKELGKISTSLINRENKEMDENEELVSWYVPCRNSLFLLFGLAIAESEFISNKKEYDVYLGIKYEGESRFKDTTPEFIESMNSITKFCTQEGDYNFKAPFLEKEKEELIKMAKQLGVDLASTYSCYIGSGSSEIGNGKIPIHCGKCAGCKARKKGFRFSEEKDPSIYLD